MYIYERQDWPDFRWDQEQLAARIAAVRHRQGLLVGRMQALGFGLQDQASLETLTEEVVKSSDIEGETLSRAGVRSSIARRLGVDIGALAPADRNVEGIVEITLDATRHYEASLSAKRLFGWHSALFPTGRSGLRPIRVGRWRDDSTGPMQVVSGAIGRERVHYQAPAASRVGADMTAFLSWLNKGLSLDPVLKAGVAHLWFVTVHPFDDGNGRIARVIADMMLARSDGSSRRFYSMSSQIRRERSAYYRILEDTQKGDLDITSWLLWFLECLDRAFDDADRLLAGVWRRAQFWKRYEGSPFNERQRIVLARVLNGLEGKLTTSKWAKLAKVSQDTAGRDINDLVDRGILVKEAAGGRSTSYRLADD